MQQEPHSFDQHEPGNDVAQDSEHTHELERFPDTLRAIAEEERKSTSPLSSLAQSRIAKAMGLGLLAAPFLAADFQSTETCEMPQIPDAVRALAETSAEILETHDGVQLRIARHDQVFEGTYGDREFSGSINSAGEVTEYTIGEHVITLSTPRPYEHHEHHLRHFVQALTQYEETEAFSDFRADDQSFKSYDGVHLFFSHEQDEATHRFVLSKDLVAEVTETPAAGAARNYTEAQDEVSAFEAGIEQSVTESLPEGYREEQALRAARTRLLERSVAIDEQMQVYLDKYQDIPDKKQEWVNYQNGFHEKRNDHLEFLRQHRPDNTDQGSYQQHIRDLQKVLASYESYLSIAPAANEFTTNELLTIAERLERNEGVNVRRKALLDAETGLSGTNRQQFESEWNRLVSTFQKDYGWERWDPNSLSQDRYNQILTAIDAHCARYEALAEIEDVVRDATLRETYAQKMAQYSALQEAVTAAAEASSTYTIQVVGAGETITMRMPKNEAGVLYLERTNGNVTQTDKYKDGHHYNRKIVDETAGEKQVITYHRNGHVQYDIQYDLDSGTWDLNRQEYHREDGTLQYIIDDDAGTTTYCTEAGDPLITIGYNETRSDTAFVRMSRRDGEGTLGLYADEVRKGTVQNTSEYLDLLAKELHTPERLHNYFEHFMKYTSDGPTDNWQRSSRTVQRTANGRMLGDCDDYAFLARDILRKQGQNAHVVYIPGHAICLWVEKDDQGKYHAHTIGTYGYDHNGNRFEEELDESKVAGYASVKEAVNAVFKKYEKADTGLEEGTSVNVNDGNVTIMTISARGSRTYTTTSLEYLLRDLD